LCKHTAIGAGAEVVYIYTPPTDQVVRIDLDPAVTNFDASVYVAECLSVAEDTCVAAADLPGIGAEELVVPMKGGHTYYIVVDGIVSSLDVFNIGIEVCADACTGAMECGSVCGVSCGTCPEGSVCGETTQKCLGGGIYDDCASAAVYAGISILHEGNTDGGTDTYTPPSAGACLQPSHTAGGLDEAIVFTPTGTATYKFVVTSDFNAGLYIVEDCENIDGTCLAAGEGNGANGTDVAYADLAMSVPIYVIVDGVGAEKGTYVLDIEQCTPDCVGKECGDDSCGGVCGTCPDNGVCSPAGECPKVINDTCESAEVIPNDSLPWVSALTDTTEANDDYANDDGGNFPVCADGLLFNGAGLGAPDVAFEFTAPATAGYTFTLTDQTTFDSALHIVKGDCSDFAANCLHGDDIIDPKGGEVIGVQLNAGDTIFIIVDGWGNGAAGQAELFVQQVPDEPG